MNRVIVIFLAAAGVLAGCRSGYRWSPEVPDDMRSISVPTFRNESDVTELGSVMTTQLLREFQRDGTFVLRPAGEAALEIQGVVRKVTSGISGYDRRGGMRTTASDAAATVVISIIDKRNGRVLVDNRPYLVHAPYTAANDRITALRDASGRLGEDLARQVVDDVLNQNWKNSVPAGKESGK